MAAEHRDPGRRRKFGPSGFRPASVALSETLRSAGATRGFAEHRLIARWEEVVGVELAAFTAPVKIAYGVREGLGATLLLAADGARAVEAAHLADRIVERVNAIYGYRAIARVKVVQTGRSGAGAPLRGAAEAPGPSDAAISPDISAISDEALRVALARLEANLRRKSARNA